MSTNDTDVVTGLNQGVYDYSEMKQKTLSKAQERVEAAGHTMDVNVKQRWLNALRSGEYSQTIGALKRVVDVSDEKCIGNCCLGVFVEVLGVPQRAAHNYEETDLVYFAFGESEKTDQTIWEEGTLPSTFADGYGLSDDALEILMEKNDNGVSFLEIADWIEEYL